MIGIVLASHSVALANAVKEVADLMSRGSVTITPVGGTGDPENPYGSNPIAIAEAIQATDSGDGVLVFMDVGSSVIGVVQALEFIPPSLRERVRLCAGPLVEGAVLAAAQASSGSDMSMVLHDATHALQAKAALLDGIE